MPRRKASAWRGSDHDLAMQVATSKRCSATSRTLAMRTRARRRRSSRRDGKFFVNTDGAGRQARRLRGQVHVRRAPAAAIPDRAPRAGACRRSRSRGTRGRRRKAGSAGSTCTPDRTSRPAIPLHWTGSARTGTSMCAECHSTNLRKNFDASAGEFKTTWSEINVSCEACHGPGSNHVAWAQQARRLAVRSPRPRDSRWRSTSARASPGRRSRRPATRTRSQRALVGARDRNVRALPRARQPHLRRLSCTASRRSTRIGPRCSTSDLYWNDGQMRDEVYNWGSFLQSRMHRAGRDLLRLPRSAFAQAPRGRQRGVRAMPRAGEVRHRGAHASRGGNARRGLRGVPHADDDLHGGRPAPRSFAAHSATRSLGEARHAATPATTATTKQIAQWAADAIAQWTGKAPASYQNFAEALHAGSIGAPGARGALLDAHRRQGAAGDRARQRHRASCAAC